MTCRAQMVRTFYCDEGFSLMVEGDLWVFTTGDLCFFHQTFRGDLDPIWVYEDIAQFDESLAGRFLRRAFGGSDSE